MIFKSPKGETVHALKDLNFTIKKGEVLKQFITDFIRKYKNVKYTFYTNSNFNLGLVFYKMKDLKIPFAVISFLLVQLGGAVWFASQLESRVSTLEESSLAIAKENRKFLVNEVIPAFKRDNWLGQGWENKHF